MERKQTLESIKELITEITMPELIEKCDKGEIDINSTADQIWCSCYSGDAPEIQAYCLLESFIDLNIYNRIHVDPKQLFTKIYAVKDHADQQDIIAFINQDSIDITNFNNNYVDVKDMFELKPYIDNQRSLYGNYVPQTFDPFAELREEYKNSDEYKQQEELGEKVKSGEITKTDALIELGVLKEIKGNDPNINYKKVTELYGKLAINELALNELDEMIQNNQLTFDELKVVLSFDPELQPLVVNKLVVPEISAEELIMHMYNWYNGENYTLDKFIKHAFAINSHSINYDRIIPGVIDKKSGQILDGVKILEVIYNNRDILSNIKMIDNKPFFIGKIVADMDSDLEFVFTIYWDGQDVKVYVPIKGNMVNPISNELFYTNKSHDISWAILQTINSDELFSQLISGLIFKTQINAKSIDMTEIEKDIIEAITVD